MTVAVRVIPCLDVDAGRVVKGVNFADLRDAGDPVELAAAYDAEGADELVFLDITASSGGQLHRVPGVAQVSEVDPLHHPPRVHVQTRNDPDRDGHVPTPGL